MAKPAITTRLELCRLIVPVDVNDANPNRLRSLRQRMRVTKLHRDTARLIWLRAGKPRSTGPVEIDLIVRRGRRLDQLNIWAAMKHVVDGIFVKGLTPDDSEKWLRPGKVEQQIERRFTYMPEVEIIVRQI